MAKRNAYILEVSYKFQANVATVSNPYVMNTPQQLLHTFAVIEAKLIRQKSVRVCSRRSCDQRTL